MIIGTGIDIVRVERFSKLVKNDTFLERFFHAHEVSYVKSCGSGASENMAARFAAKEALGKALGTGIGCLTLKNICVTKTAEGKPNLVLYDDVQEKFEKSGANYLHLSLSHEKDYAIAQVILEKL